MDKITLVELLNSEKPSYTFGGNICTYVCSEIVKKLDQKVVMISFILDSKVDETIDLKTVAKKLTKLASDNLLLVDYDRVGPRIVLYVDFPKDAEDPENNGSFVVQKAACLNNNNCLVEQENNREALKSILRNNQIFNKVRDFLAYYARNCDSHHRDLNGSSYLREKVELANCGLKMSTEELKSLYVEFCKDQGDFNIFEISEDLDYREKTIIAKRICDYNQAITNGSHEARFATAKNWLMEYVSAKSDKLNYSNFKFDFNG